MAGIFDGNVFDSNVFDTGDAAAAGLPLGPFYEVVFDPLNLYYSDAGRGWHSFGERD